MNSSPK